MLLRQLINNCALFRTLVKLKHTAYNLWSTGFSDPQMSPNWYISIVLTDCTKGQCKAAHIHSLGLPDNQIPLFSVAVMNA